MEANKDNDVIDLRKIARKIRENKKKFFIVLPAVFVLSCAYVLCLPRYYSSEVKMVPEMSGPSMGGTLGDLASSFGIDLNDMQTSDAISPLLYPDLMEDNAFVASLFNIRVKSASYSDLQVDTTYYAYMKKYQKQAPWKPVISSIKKLFQKKETATGKGGGKYDPYFVSKKDDNVMNNIRENIKFSIDKKTAVITLSVKAQDPYICKCLADSVQLILQDFITEYRTSKARVDAEHYKKLTEEARVKYQESIKAYSKLVDAEQDLVLQSEKSKQEELENEMQMNYNAYSTLKMQYQTAEARVQERTPVFTTLKGAAVPIKPAGPKRMITVIGLTLMAFIIMSLYIARKELHFSF